MSRKAFVNPSAKPFLSLAWRCLSVVDLVDLGVCFDVVVDGDSRKVLLKPLAKRGGVVCERD